MTVQPSPLPTPECCQQCLRNTCPQQKLWWCYTSPLSKVSVYRKFTSTTMIPLPSKPTRVAYLPDSRGVNAQQGIIGTYMGKHTFLVAILHAYKFPEGQNPYFQNGLFWAIPLKGKVHENGFPTAFVLHPSQFMALQPWCIEPAMTTCISPTSPSCQTLTSSVSGPPHEQENSGSLDCQMRFKISE